jgi:hypothetical protein
MRNPLRRLYNLLQDLKKHAWYCEYWKNCKYFREDSPYCTNYVGDGCGKHRYYNKKEDNHE